MNIKDLQSGSYKVVTPGKGAPLNIKDLAPGSYTVQPPQASASSQPSALVKSQNPLVSGISDTLGAAEKGLKGAQWLANTFVNKPVGAIAGALSNVTGASAAANAVDKLGNVLASQVPKALGKGIQQTAQAALKPVVAGANIGQTLAQKYPRVASDVGAIADIAQATVTLGGAGEAIKESGIGEAVKGKLQDNAIETNANKLREAAGATKPTSKTMARALARGKDDASFLAKTNILPTVEEGKIRTSTAQSVIDKRVAPLDNLLNKGLDEIQPSIKLTNIDDVRAKALSGVDNTPNLTASERESFKRDINKEFDLQKKKIGQDITLKQVNQEIKIPHSKKVPFDSTKPYRGNVNEIIRKAAQTTIEDSVPKDAFAVKELNSYIGDHYSAKKFLQSMEGNAVKGGRLGKYFARVIGTGIGESVGGPIGGLAGLLGGEAVAEIMQSTAFTNPLREFILRNIAQDNPAAFEKLKQFISKSQADMAQRKLLQAPSFVAGQQYKGEPALNYGTMQERAIRAGVKPATIDETSVGNQKYIDRFNQSQEPSEKVVDTTKALDPLIQEAKKYKSAEEFVNAQGQTVYHGSPKATIIEKEGFSLKDLGKGSGYKGVYGAGATFTTDLSRAKLYGDVVETKIPNNLKLFKTNDPVTDLFANPKIRDVTPEGLSKTLKGMGYDGVQVGDEIVIFDPSIPKTKSQLTDIWNKANKIKGPGKLK